jgi:hypothetical protein
MQNDYIDLPINLQETPKHLLEKCEPVNFPEDPNEAVDKLLKKL